jgi:acyl-coenzyme A synthetase/AMP-(fatty) acid ligase
MLACTRIGAILDVFGGFSPEARCVTASGQWRKLLVTADEASVAVV